MIRVYAIREDIFDVSRMRTYPDAYDGDSSSLCKAALPSDNLLVSKVRDPVRYDEKEPKVFLASVQSLKGELDPVSQRRTSLSDGPGESPFCI